MAMDPEKPPYNPVTGKTYSLFGDQPSTTNYYELINELLDELLKDRSKEALLREIRRSSRKNNLANLLIPWKKPDNFASRLYADHAYQLTKFTHDIQEHLRGISILESYKSVLWTTNMQYYLYMLEIELTNRIFTKAFHEKPYRLALLPHCLRDVWDSCKAEFHQFDQQCRHCKKDCYLNHISKLLKDHNIEPFIWTTRNLNRLFKEIVREKPDFGVIGIACIPELVMGMRKSTDNRIPAIGIPLNANNCIRWTGQYRPNSIDLYRLSNLLSQP